MQLLLTSLLLLRDPAVPHLLIYEQFLSKKVRVQSHDASINAFIIISRSPAIFEIPTGPPRLAYLVHQCHHGLVS